MLEEPMVSFTTFDRCDRCMAQAYAQAEKEGLTSLLFCLHHIREFRDTLLGSGWTLRFDDKAEDLFPEKVNAW